jgi:predicted SAM-dependent methyltransferase
MDVAGRALRTARRGLRLPRRLAGRARRELRRLRTRSITYETLPHEVALRLSYEIMLGREPDAEGMRFFSESLRAGTFKLSDVPQAIRGSEEFQNFVRFEGHMLGFSIHAGRSQFVKSLPRASRIVDIGGTHLARPEGALFWLGYPYRFEELTIIDLHPDERHALYKAGLNPDRVETDLGPVRYRYHSMTDLSAFADSSVDLVYSGQSFEHVTPEDGQIVLKEVMRVLRPGGHLALDTPNARVTRIQQEAFIDPDHKVEYTYPELRDLLEQAGFVIDSARGLNLAQNSVETGVFDGDEVAGHSGLFDEIESCYILCVVAHRPG